MTLSSHTADSFEDLVLTPDPVDDAFAQPYVDVDEWREVPARHRYIHGGFADNDTRFSLYLPAQNQFEGRFFQHVTPVPQSENLAQEHLTDENPVPFTLASGGYYIETNGGGPGAANPMSGVDPTIGAYRANAAAARLSRQIAEKIYGPRRIYGYLYGGSGGGYRTIGASENTDGVWDGYVPYVIGSPMAIPNVFAVRMHAQRVLRHAFPRIVDAFDAGGEPAALQLTEDERDAFDEVTQMGFPIRSWFGWETMGMHAFSVLYPGIMHADPAYANDFWSADGYLGTNPESSVHRDRVQLKTTLVELLTADTDAVATTGGVDESYKATAQPQTVIGARIADVPNGFTLGAELTILTGASAGRILRLADVNGTTILFEPGQDLAELTPGDKVLVDNSNFLAAQTYHRHQVPSNDYTVWDQFRNSDGSPTLPQRPVLLGPLFAAAASGTVPTGRISGHMIVVASLLDREAFPWQADWYRSRVSEFVGDNVDGRFRLWYTDNALHGDESGIQEYETRTVSYVGALQAALRQLSAWVEQGIAPSPSTTYTVHEGQVLVDDKDAARGGVQPVVTLSVDGSDRTEVNAGQTVTVRITAHATTHAGIITDVVTDFDGTGHFDTAQQLTPAPSVKISRECSFATPGTYLIAVRATAQAGGDADDRFARIDNIARARIVVRAVPST